MEDLAFKFNLPAPVTLAECESYDATIRATVRSLKVIAASSYFERRDILESTLEHPRTAPFYQKALEFLQSFDPIQVRYVGLAWRRILEFTLRYADRLHAQKHKYAIVEQSTNSHNLVKDSFSAVVPVREAILRLDQTGSLLTSSHLHFLKHCLDRKAFSFAIPLLDKDIYHIPCSADEKLAKLNGTIPCNPTEPVNSYITRRSGLTDKLATRQVLEYFLYGAMIYMGVGNWKRAIHFLNIVLRAPTRRCVSKVQVEAYKKWILANLIEHATV
ncbi:hypothetical protein KEM54_000589 [Ascosphaera aggregata]|nr:hypothetical protein KEM54_000589 [Ascosphaera aggregata]